MTAYDIVTEKIVAKLEAGTVPWRKTWKGAQIGEAANLMTRKPYRGINAFVTALQGYGSPYWCTYLQAGEIGAQVRKGEKGTPIVYFRLLDKESAEGEKRTVPFLRYSVVFNVAQLEGLSPKLQELVQPKGRDADFSPLPECTRIVEGMPKRPAIRHGEAHAYYSPAADFVNMPAPSLFESSEAYFGTLFHELGHNAAPQIMPSICLARRSHLCEARHNQSPSRKASSPSVGW